MLGKEHQKFALFDLKIDTLTQWFISYTRWGRFSETPCNKSNLNIENLNSKNIKPRFHLEPLQELLANGYVDNDVIKDLQSMEHKLEKKTKRKKKQLPKRNMNPISSYSHKKARRTSQGKSQDGSDDDSDDDLDNDDSDDEEDDDDNIK